MKLIRQTDAMDCGFACLAMIANRYCMFVAILDFDRIVH